MIKTAVFQDFIHLFFPKLCQACEGVLLAQEEVICMDCSYHLPFTNFHLDPKNESARQLLGKLEFEKAVSMLYLSKSSRVENLIHRLKYKDQPEIGIFLGRMYVKRLSQSDFLEGIDIIIPVPLHISKLRKRGYNQAEQFAKGISEESGIPLDLETLIRIVNSSSQTNKSRVDRYDNVQNVFSIKSSRLDLSDKHILLVDDILTTGATVCAAGNVLKEAGAKVSVMTIARA